MRYSILTTVLLDTTAQQAKDHTRERFTPYALATLREAFVTDSGRVDQRIVLAIGTENPESGCAEGRIDGCPAISEKNLSAQ